MAKEDYDVADRDGILTAGERVAESVQETPDADARDFAATNEVASAAYANYAEALNAHQEREDIETLADRRAREYGATFEAGDFMRAAAYNADGTPADAPTPGNVDGVAPSSGDDAGTGDDGDDG